jgi:hypothetical protein
MDRKEEIRIIIQHLKNDVIRISQKYSDLLADTIVKNGRLIDAYNKELKELEKNERQ